MTKMALFIPPFGDIDAEDLAHIFCQQVFAKHGTPTDIVSDRREALHLTLLEVALPAAQYQGQSLDGLSPETDGQTE